MVIHLCVPSGVPSDIPSSEVPISSDAPSNIPHDVPNSAVPSVSYVLSDAASSEVPSVSSAIPSDALSSEVPSASNVMYLVMYQVVAYLV